MKPMLILGVIFANLTFAQSQAMAADLLTTRADHLVDQGVQLGRDIVNARHRATAKGLGLKDHEVWDRAEVDRIYGQLKLLSREIKSLERKHLSAQESFTLDKVIQTDRDLYYKGVVSSPTYAGVGY